MITKKIALKELLLFAGPIILGQLGWMLIGTGDLLIAGRYSRECLAAIGLAVAIANPIMLSFVGLQFAISPLLAQKRGKGERVSDYFWTTIIYSLAISILSWLLTFLSAQLVPLLGYEKDITEIIQEYLIITSFSSFTLCLFQGLKEYFQSEEKTLIANIVTLIAVVINVLLNYVLVFGKFGFPELQEAGLAWGSLGVRSFMGMSLFLLAYKQWKEPFKIHFSFIKDLWKLGLPIALAFFMEIMAFCAVTLFIGKFPEVQTAANNLVLNISSLSFMGPLSIASAVGVKVGHAFGEQSLARIRVFEQVSLFTSFCITLVAGLLFYFFPLLILSLYTDDEAVKQWGKTLLFWCACFQLFDGAQVTMGGILRGLGVTRAPSVAIFIGYWIIGIPLGYVLGFHMGFEAQGFWIGLALSLALVSFMLGIILKRKIRTLSEQGF